MCLFFGVRRGLTGAARASSALEAIAKFRLQRAPLLGGLNFFLARCDNLQRSIWQRPLKLQYFLHRSRHPGLNFSFGREDLPAWP
jgi:hypothetical protein